MRYPGFFGGSDRVQSYMADSEELINMYREQNPPDAPTPASLLLTPGFEDIDEVPEGPGRGSLAVGSLEYFVAGFMLYERNGSVITGRGTLAADGNPATLSWNGPAGGQLFVTSGDVGYILDLTTFVLTTVLTSGATMGAYLDGYFLALDAATGTLAISDLLDGLTWDPTQIAQRSSAPDPWVAMTVTKTEIDLLGSLTRETWFNAGTSPYPFQPIPGAFREQGIVAPFSLPRDVSPVMWVAQNAQGGAVVMMRQGYDGVRVSTHAVERSLQGVMDLSTASSISYQEQGHLFYMLTVPDVITWAYDVTEGLWARRAKWNTLTSTWEPLRVSTHVFTSTGVHLMQDRASGALYRMSLDLFTDVDGALILRERTPPRLSAPGQVRFNVPWFQLLMDVGVGVLGSSTTDPSVNPHAMLRTSKDGGKTWGPERTASIGKIGEYQTRVFWTTLGQYRNLVPRFRFACACPIRIVDTEIEMTVGTS